MIPAAEKYYNKISGIKKYYEKEHFDRHLGGSIIQEYIYYSSLPKKYRDVSFKEYNGIENYDIDWDRLEYKGYVFSGPPGLGKTMLACIIAKAIIIDKIGREPFKVLFINEPAYFQKLTRDINYSQYKIDDLLKANYIIYDELGGEPRQSDFIISTRYYIINELYNREIPVIFTINYEMEKLYEILGSTAARIIDRIGEMCTGIKFQGDSKR